LLLYDFKRWQIVAIEVIRRISNLVSERKKYSDVTKIAMLAINLDCFVNLILDVAVEKN